MPNDRSYGQRKPAQNYQKPAPKPPFELSELNEKSYVEIAEKVIRNHSESYKTITMTQMRNLLELMSVLRERLRADRRNELDDEMISEVQYMKLRFVYAAGRDIDSSGVREFIMLSRMIECLETVNNSAKQFELVCKYMEALVAYHKYYIQK